MTYQESTNSSIIINCECYCQMLHVSSWDDDNTNIILAPYFYHNQKDGFFAKLKKALKYLRTGRISQSELVLSNEDAKKLGNFLIEKTKNNVF